jgi:DNA-binding Xre family transcriptional regulator
MAYLGFGGEIVHHALVLIDEAHKAAGIRLQKLADECGISIARMARIMTKKAQSLLKTHLAKICKVISIDLKTGTAAIVGRKNPRSG